MADREEISLGLRDGDTFTAIAIRLGKAVSTVSREVAGNRGRNEYRAWRAHQQARDRARRPKTPKLSCARLAAQVTQWLQECWSPQEITGRLRMEFADDPMMHVSHEQFVTHIRREGISIDEICPLNSVGTAGFEPTTP
ncbi:transposase [Micromonospora sp. DT47]|uniref:transposase n=1 Tax=Micromonospora sp. DT47 TaxID=3393431 RepID=UPI003CF29FE9